MDASASFPLLLVVVMVSLLAVLLLVAALLRGRRAATEATQQNAAQTAALTAANARLEERAARVPELEAALAQAQAAQSTLQVEVGRLNQALLAAEALAAERATVLASAQESLRDQFRALAADYLETGTKRLQEQNQTQLAHLLDPLRARIVEFQKKVEDVYVDESKERSALKQQVESLVQLNRALTDEAKNLTAALRGSVKQQGNWGELVLERVLEASGLRKGEEYVVQDSQTAVHGRRQLPDVVVHLPEGRRLVIDAKVTLIAYERFATVESESERAVALREHLTAIRNHLRALSEKRYQNLYGPSLDFVLMFVPVEPAFMAAVTHDNQLFMDAWARNVLLVSPSTLLFVVRTVAHLWRQEAQSRNAQDIARRGGELYDKLTGFVSDLQLIGARIGAAQGAYDDALKKLADGRGNVIRQAEMLRDLGVKPAKSLPRDLVERAAEGADRERHEGARLDGAPPAAGTAST